MTREEALHNLNLPPDAGPEAVEKAYQRLARRYHWNSIPTSSAP